MNPNLPAHNQTGPQIKLRIGYTDFLLPYTPESISALVLLQCATPVTLEGNYGAQRFTTVPRKDRSAPEIEIIPTEDARLAGPDYASIQRLEEAKNKADSDRYKAESTAKDLQKQLDTQLAELTSLRALKLCPDHNPTPPVPTPEEPF